MNHQFIFLRCLEFVLIDGVVSYYRQERSVNRDDDVHVHTHTHIMTTGDNKEAVMGDWWSW